MPGASEGRGNRLGHQTAPLSAAELHYLRRTEYMTSTQAARVCGVCPRTTSMWCDTNQLPHHRLPKRDGSPGERRIKKADLFAFMRAWGIPFPPRLEGVCRVHVFGTREDLPRILRLNAADLIDVEQHAGVAVAGMALALRPPDVLLLDWESGDHDCRQLMSASLMLERPPRLVAVTGTLAAPQSPVDCGADACHAWPGCDVSLLVRDILGVTDG